MKVRLLPQAYDDIERLKNFLLSKNAGAAARVVDLLFESAKALRDAPRTGRPVGRAYRELIARFGRGAYVIRYRIDEARSLIIITRIWHSRERRTSPR